MTGKSLPALDARLAHRAAREPRAVALVDADGPCDYARLDALVDAAARHLTRLGVRAGDRVATIADKRVATIACLFAAMRLRAVMVPVNPRLLGDQVRHVLTDSGAKVLAGRAAPLKALSGALAGLPDLRTLHLDGVDPPGAAELERTDRGTDVRPLPMRDAARADDSPAAILYTSGSTADPKGVVLSGANLAHGADSVATYLGLGADDRTLALMPLSFDYGLNQIMASMHAGARAVLFDALVPRDVVDAVLEHGITGLPAVPHLWNRLARLKWPEVPSLRYATNTGGHLAATTSARLARALPGVRLFAMYGFTEAFRATYLDPARLAERPDSVGTAVPHARTLVVDVDGAEVAPGETGELIQSGPLVALGYWRAEAATRARFRPRPGPHDDGLRYAWSGDLFRRDAEGLLYFVSRRDDVAKLHGYRVNPAEIERVLASCPAVRDVCVVCVPHPTLGEAALAVVVAEPSRLGDIESHARRALPPFMRPERTLVVGALPDGPHGKIDRRALRERHARLFDGADDAR